MAFSAFRVRLPADQEDVATAVLWELGTTGIEVHQEGCESVLLAYFPEPPGATGLEARLQAELSPLPGARLEAVPVPEVDWLSRFRESFRAFTVGRFRIVPVWDAPSPPPAHLLVVDPGQAFGTGTHESTRLCLRLLEAEAEDRGSLPRRVLDLGTGSALLAVAAARLGAPCVVASDLDRDCLPVARRHARLNGVVVHLVLADGGRAFLPGLFDLILANLSAPLLKERRSEIAGLLARAGRLVLSGFLVSDLPELQAAYAVPGVLRTETEGDWAALLVGAPTLGGRPA